MTFYHHYRIDHLIAQGASQVFLAYCPLRTIPVCIKVLTTIDESHLVQFQNEAKILQMISHPHIVHGLENGLWNSKPFIVMNFVSGQSLKVWVQEQPRPLSESLLLIEQLIDAMFYLHQQQIIHGDIKPENILVDAHVLTVIDFGLASSPQIPSASTFMGTPLYMSPEIFTHARSYSSDIYALGMVAYEIITGVFSRGRIQISALPKGLQPLIASLVSARAEQRPTIAQLKEQFHYYTASSQYNTDCACHNAP